MNGAPPPRRRRHPAVKLTLLLVALAVSFALVELAFRLFWTLPPWFAEFQQAGMYVATADGDVALRPGYRGELVVDAPTTIATNALGMRGPEVAAKRADERRLLVLGDSVVWGYGVEYADTFAARLQAGLTADGGAWTVGNAGVPGYGSKHMALHLARLDQPFGADAFVVCGYLGNDPLDDAQPQRTVFAGLQLQGAWARLVHDSWRARLMYRSRAALFVEAWLHHAAPARSLAAQLRFPPEEAAMAAGFTQDKLYAGLFLDVIDADTKWDPNAPPVVPRALAMLESSLRAMRRDAGTRPLVFVILPTSYQVLEDRRIAELTKRGFDPKQFERGRAQQRWFSAAKAVGVPALDATPILAAEADAAALFLSDGGHLSARGHALVAAWLARELPALLAR
jgi:lysophospholipase L1-like esterase